MFRGQVRMYLPPGHPIIAIWNNRIPNGRHITEKVHNSSLFRRSLSVCCLRWVSIYIYMSWVMYLNRNHHQRRLGSTCQRSHRESEGGRREIQEKVGWCRGMFDMVNKILFVRTTLQCIYWNWSHPDNENQSDGRTETIEPNIFKSSQANVGYKTMKSQLFVVMHTRLQCRLSINCQAQTVSTFMCLNYQC